MTTTTRIEVSAGVGGPPRCTFAQGPLAVRRLRSTADGVVRVALVQAGALLLAGDEVRVRVRVDGPVAVEVVETAGTVAYDMRGGAALWDVDIALSDGARLAWHGEPFVLSRGACVERRTAAHVGPASALALRETLVFGRSGETGGTLLTRTRLDLDRVPAVVEDLDLSPEARADWTTLRGSRCLDSIATVGTRLPDGPDVLQGDAETSLARCLTDEVHLSRMPAVWVDAHGRVPVLPRIRA